MTQVHPTHAGPIHLIHLTQVNLWLSLLAETPVCNVVQCTSPSSNLRSALFGMRVEEEGWLEKKPSISDINVNRALPSSHHKAATLLRSFSNECRDRYVQSSAYGGQLDLWLETSQQRRGMAGGRVFNLSVCVSFLLLTSRPDSLLPVTLTCFT